VTTPNRVRDRRLEVRTTAAERALIERAAIASGMDLTTFVVGKLVESAQRLLADRDRFDLSLEADTAWREVNSRPAGDLEDVRQLMQRRSPFEG